MPEKKAKTTSVKEEAAKFKGRFIESIGRRKTATARVRLFKGGKGAIVINSKKLEDYFDPTLAGIAAQSVKLAGLDKELDFSVVVNGGGKKGQADAVRHGISRTLLEMEETLRPVLKAKDFLTRDARKKERKKPGLKKARKSSQWAKR